MSDLQTIEDSPEDTGEDTGTATVLTVSTQAEFKAACWTLAQNGGGTIKLEAGETYALQMSDYLDTMEDSPLTITSSDPDDPAVLSYVNLRERENITFDGVKFDAAFGDVPVHTMLQITDCENIRIINCDMTSSAEGVLGVAGAFTPGLNLATVRSSDGIVFSGNTATGFLQGLTVMDSYDTTVTGNAFSGFQGDGIRIAGASGLLVEGNHMHDFVGAVYEKNHPDFIQIWGSNIAVNNENITIRENILDTGDGQAYQGIFGRNEDLAKNGFLYEGLVVEHNVIYSPFWAGISLSDTLGAVVRNNTVINNPDAHMTRADGTTTTGTMSSWIKVSGQDGLVENNIAHNTWGAEDNAVLGTAATGDGADVYSHFVNIEAGGSGDMRDLMLRPDSPLNGSAGSRLTWWSEPDAGLRAIADVTIDAADKSVVHLDAALSHAAGGDLAEASFVWSFDDGTTLTGRSVSHDFVAAGRHSYTLTVTDRDGTSDSITRTVTLEDTVTLDLQIGDDGLQDRSNFDLDLAIASSVAIEDGWIDLGDQARIGISRFEPRLFDLTSLNYEMTLKPDDGASGAFLHQYGTLGASLDEAGRVTFYVSTSNGLFKAITEEPIFADGEAHHLNLVYSDQAQMVGIYVDGALAASAEASGITAPMKFWGLTFGHSWGDGLDTLMKDVRLSTEAPTGEVIARNYAELRAADIAADFCLEASGHSALPEALAEALAGSESFEVAIDLSAAMDETAGRLLYLRDCLSLEIAEDGSVTFALQTLENGWKAITSGPVDLHDGTTHRLSVVYDSELGIMQLRDDGEVIAQATHFGQTPASTVEGLTLDQLCVQGTADVQLSNIEIWNTARIASARDIAETLGASYDIAPRDCVTTSGDGAAPTEPQPPEPDALLSLNFNDGTFSDASRHQVTASNFDTDKFVFSAHEDGMALEIQRGDHISLDREFGEFYARDSFEFSFSLRSDTPNGENVFGIHHAMSFQVRGDDARFWMKTEQGTFIVRSDADVLADREWHDVIVSYDSDAGRLALSIDGAVVDQIEASGTTYALQYHSFKFGNQWGSQGFDGGIDNFVMHESPTQISSGETDALAVAGANDFDLG